MKINLPPKVVSVLGRILQWLAVTAGCFAWWMAMLLLVSLFTVNVWHVTFEQILLWSGVLTAVSGAVYAGVMAWRARAGG
ncbi:MAG: hypothetical protein IKH77_08620 [Clostridia bacterium]|nr:hypothetical protein [Clostridia bacterium]